jgi:hypothetical protein
MSDDLRYEVKIHTPSYDVKIHTSSLGMDPSNDNVDVEVVFSDGRRFMAAFFTLENIRYLFVKNRITGENKQGLYFWASDMIIVRELTEEVIVSTIENLITEGDFARVFSSVDV